MSKRTLIDVYADTLPMYLATVVGLGLLVFPEPSGATKAAGLAILTATYIANREKKRA